MKTKNQIAEYLEVTLHCKNVNSNLLMMAVTRAIDTITMCGAEVTFDVVNRGSGEPFEIKGCIRDNPSLN
jgi:hypothetical protein